MTISRKRLALFAGQADEAYQSRFISGFLKNAFASGFDVCVFSMYRKYQDTPEHEQGDSNIFSLMNPEKFDGAVILKDSIQTTNAAQELENHLKENFDKPIVVIEKESQLFPSICTDGYSAVFELIKHLIDVHGCRDIAFVSGKKWHEHSKERLQAFVDAMHSAGLTVPEDRILYGDYWYQSGELCAEQLMSQGKPLPDAVACANDQMAIGLCKAFTAHGIRVPEDIAVVGYDSTYEGRTSPRSITSALIPAEEFGEYAFNFLIDKINGVIPDSFKLKPCLLIGESCGCHNESMPVYTVKRESWGTDISEEGYNSIFNSMDETLIAQSSLNEFLSTVYSYAYQINGVSEFHLCIDPKWKNIGRGINVTNTRYSDQMIHAIRYCSDHKNNMAGIEESFPTEEMLPELDEDRDTPAAYIFTPVFYGTNCFGYAALRYENGARSYDELYRCWMSSVCRGFEMLRRNTTLKYTQEQLERISSNKFAVYSYAYESLNEEEKAEYKLVSQILDDNLLDYHFQPIIRVSDGQIYAYEALMRARIDAKLSPLSIIKYATMQERLSDVERATFLNILAILNEKHASFGSARVFINSIPGVKISDDDLSTVNNYLRKFSGQVVVELTEEAELKDNDLEKLKAFFSKLNVDIAVDDYGTGYSNVSNLLRYMPNYVKIDRALLSEIHNQPRKQHFVREIIDFCHDNNILALAEGIETSEELRTVIHLGADLIQGFYTARPSAEIITQIDEKCRNEIKQYYQERVDGNTKKVYYAGKSSRISLTKVINDGYTDIVVGKEGMVYKDVSIIGTPMMKTDMHLRVEPGHNGRITLEDVCFSNIKSRPCIEIGKKADVTLVLHGTNVLNTSGIQVPETARLVIEGEGALNIDLNAPETYGIGNDHHSTNGELIFEQDGPININCRGKSTICIGSGYGGDIHINRGEYNFNIDTETAVAIGALKGEVNIEITTCHIESDCAASTGTFIGSLENSADISLARTSVNFYAHNKNMAVFGTLRGKKAAVRTDQVSLVLSIMADNSTCFGALYGETELNLCDSHLKLDIIGQEALAFGGYNADNSYITLTDSDTKIDIRSAIGKAYSANDENFVVKNGRMRLIINGKEVERSVSIEYK